MVNAGLRESKCLGFWTSELEAFGFRVARPCLYASRFRVKLGLTFQNCDTLVGKFHGLGV